MRITSTDDVNLTYSVGVRNDKEIEIILMIVTNEKRYIQ